MPAEGTSCLWNLFALGGPGATDAIRPRPSHATPFNVMSFHAGGTGARPGIRRPFGHGVPERREERADRGQRGGVAARGLAKEYRQDSGGAGEFRGGLGQVMEVGTARQRAVCAQRLLRPHRLSGARPRRRPERHRPARTLASGKVLRGKGLQTVPSKDRVIIAMPGGGGLGNPRKRRPRRGRRGRAPGLHLERRRRGATMASP